MYSMINKKLQELLAQYADELEIIIHVGDKLYKLEDDDVSACWVKDSVPLFGHVYIATMDEPLPD
jgi:hypothetical protein